MNTQRYPTITLVAVLLIVFAGMPLGMYAQVPELPLPPPLPVAPPPLDPSTTSDAPGPRILPERVALIPSIPPFTNALSPGNKGENVRNLQRFLNQHGFLVAEAGLDSTGRPQAGSPGHETDYYGPLTRKAVVRYQSAYGAYVLAPADTTEASGVFGPRSFSYANQLMQHGFVNMFPKETPSTSNNAQLASVVGSGATTKEALTSLLAAIKQQVENLKSLLPATSQ